MSIFPAKEQFRRYYKGVYFDFRLKTNFDIKNDKKKITIFIKEVLFITNMFKIPFSFTGYYNKRYYRPKTIIKKGTFLSCLLTPTVTYELLHFYN